MLLANDNNNERELTNVVNLNDERAARQKSTKTYDTKDDTTVAEVTCENGVCSVNWHPKRKTDVA